MTLRMAFTGAGHISRVHARAAQSIEGIELAAIVNHRPESMAEYAAQFGISRQYATVADLLADGDVDILSVNTPNYLHAPQTLAALEAGVHVMVEKPMAMNTTEAEAMQRASEQSSAKLMVAHCWRFDEEVNWLKRQIDSGRLGKILRTRGYGVHVNWGPGGWFVEAQLAGGGALADMGVHAIDAARYLLGDPQPLSVYARIAPNTPNTMSMTAAPFGSIGKAARCPSSNQAGGGPTLTGPKQVHSYTGRGPSGSYSQRIWKSLIAKRRLSKPLILAFRRYERSIVRKKCTTGKWRISSTASAKIEIRRPGRTKVWSICGSLMPRSRVVEVVKWFTCERSGALGARNNRTPP